MDFPADAPRQIETPVGLVEALGVPILETWAARFLVAIVDSEATVRRVKPDLRAVEAISFGETGDRGNAPKYGPEHRQRILALLDRPPPVDPILRRKL